MLRTDFVDRYVTYRFCWQVCYGYKADQCKEGLFLVLVFLTGGLILLLLQWRPQMVCYLRKKRCSLNQADTILLQVMFQMIERFLLIIIYFMWKMKVTSIDQSHESHTENKIKVRTNIEHWANLRWDQVPRRNSIPCWLVTLVVSLYRDHLLNSSNLSSKLVWNKNKI
jgi:hypothetical protein